MQYDLHCLQEEISRTNKKLERLLKEKAQHDIEINNLKARISSRENSIAKNAEAAAGISQLLEDKLEDVQDQLNDVADERDSKAKMEKFQNDFDTWVYLSEAQNARVLQLIKDLETEHRHSPTLMDLVTELQLQLNGMRRSVECEDRDAATNSLQHNSCLKEYHVMTHGGGRGDDRPDKDSVNTIKTGLKNED